MGGRLSVHERYAKPLRCGEVWDLQFVEVKMEGEKVLFSCVYLCTDCLLWLRFEWKTFTFAFYTHF